MLKQRDIIIIGSGLAGAPAALHAARSGFNVIAFSKPNDPGYWARVKKLRQFPGVQENTSGAELLKRIREQAEVAGAVFHEYEITSIKATESHTFQVDGNNSESYEAPVVIIASGVSKDEHFLAGERELVGKGVYYSVWNDGPSLKHQSAAIIGKTEEASNAAIYLSQFAEKIAFIIPSSKLDVPENVFRNLESNKKIEMMFSSSIKKLNGTDDELHSIAILRAGEEYELKARAAFIYTYNLRPCSTFAKDLIDIDQATGRIPVNSTFQTSRPGVFACGDILAGELQNPSVSIAQGTIAAINAEKFMRS